MKRDGFTTGVLLIGGGLAGYLAHRCIAEPELRNGRSPRVSKRYTRTGRTILRDGVAVIDVVRVDLGDQRFAITPHQTDVLTEQIVRLLNRHRAR